VSVVCCQVEVSATSWSLVQRSPTDCGVSQMCVIVKRRKMRRPRPPRGCRAIEKIIVKFLTNYLSFIIIFIVVVVIIIIIIIITWRRKQSAFETSCLCNQWRWKTSKYTSVISRIITTLAVGVNLFIHVFMYNVFNVEPGYLIGILNRPAFANRWSARKVWWSVEKFGHYLQFLCLLYCFIIFWFVFVSPTQGRSQFSPYYVESNFILIKWNFYDHYFVDVCTFLKKIMLVVRGIQNCEFSGPW
jgi:hypothetical protein